MLKVTHGKASINKYPTDEAAVDMQNGWTVPAKRTASLKVQYAASDEHDYLEA